MSERAHKLRGLHPAIHPRLAAIMAACKHSYVDVLEIGENWQPCYVCNHPAMLKAAAVISGGDEDAEPLCRVMAARECPRRRDWMGPEAIVWLFE